MKRLLSVGLVIAIAVAGFVFFRDKALEIPEQSEWVLAKDPPSGIQAELPTKAEPLNRSVPDRAGGTLTIRKYLSELGDDKAAMSLGFIDRPGANVNAAGVLESGLHGETSETAGSIESKTPTTQNGHSALDAVITFKKDGSEGIAFVRIVATTNHLIHVQSLGNKSDRGKLQEIQNRILSTLVIPE